MRPKIISLIHKTITKKMKKLVYALSLVAAVAVLATSCKKDETVTPEEKPATGVVFVDGYASFYGTDYTETNNFSVVLYTDMTYDEEGYFTSKGSAVQLDIFTPDTVLAAGTYTYSRDTYEAGTFDGGDYTKWYEFDDNGDQTAYGIQSGTVTLAVNNGVYTIDIQLTDSLGNARTGKFEGELGIYDERENPYEYEPTTPTELTIAAPADSIDILNYGDIYETGTDNMTLLLWDDNAAVSLELFTEAGATSLPTGTYTFAEDGSAMTLLPGELAYGLFPSGSYASTEDAVYWLSEGELNINKTDDDYTITGTLKSHFGSTITINYTGKADVQIYDEGEESEAAPAAKTVRRHIGKQNMRAIKARI